MLLNDIPVSISHVKASLSADTPYRINIASNGKRTNVVVLLDNIDCVVASVDKLYLHFRTAIVCNPRSKKPKHNLVLKSSHIQKLVTVLKPSYDTRTWNCKKFDSIGYGKELFVSPPDIGVIFIADGQNFCCVKRSEIRYVHFLRTMPGTRSFDLALTLHSGEEQIFENIDKSQLIRLHNALEQLGALKQIDIDITENSESESVESSCSDAEWEAGTSCEETSSDSESSIY